LKRGHRPAAGPLGGSRPNRGAFGGLRRPFV